MLTKLTKVSTKGQVVIPQALRQALGIEQGDLLRIERVDDTILLRKVALAPLEEKPGQH